MQVQDGADFFAVQLKQGQQYVMRAASIWVLVVVSGLSRCPFVHGDMLTPYKLLDNMIVYTTLVGNGTVGIIP